MTTHTLPDSSYISLSVDTETSEVIIEDIKSNTKGNGRVLVDWAINYAREQGYFEQGYDMSLYSYPQDGTINSSDLHQFWLAMGFVDGSEQSGEGYLMILD
jgi:hypothetical protein